MGHIEESRAQVAVEVERLKAEMKQTKACLKEEKERAAQ
jgi:hypothetical protein